MRPLSLSLAILFGIFFFLLPDIVTPELVVLFFVVLALLAVILWITWLVFYRRY